MNEVQPVRDTQDVRRIAEFLEKHYSQTFSDAWLFGCCVALRVSDLMAIKFNDIKRTTKGVFVSIKQSKTGKVARIELSGNAIEIYTRRKKDCRGDTYLFQSQWKYHNEPSGLSRYAIAKALKDACESLEIPNIGTHSMRKTLGYHAYQRTGDLALVQKMLGHTSSAHTLRYIGITADQTNAQFSANYF